MSLLIVNSNMSNVSINSNTSNNSINSNMSNDSINSNMNNILLIVHCAIYKCTCSICWNSKSTCVT